MNAKHANETNHAKADTASASPKRLPFNRLALPQFDEFPLDWQPTPVQTRGRSVSHGGLTAERPWDRVSDDEIAPKAMLSNRSAAISHLCDPKANSYQFANLKTQDAVARLRVLVETTDGFKIAEADLALRGPGELCGRDQSGLLQFKFGDFARDLRLVERAQDLAVKILDQRKAGT